MKKQSREHYRKQNPRSQKRTNVTDSIGTDKEVEVEGLDGFHVMRVLSLTETAEVWGRNQMTVKRWIRDKIIPAPIIFDTSRGYSHYTASEVAIVAKLLEEHARTYDYLHYTHQTMINRIWQGIEGYRREEIFHE